MRTFVQTSMLCIMCFALLTCTPPNFDDDPVPTGNPLTVSPLKPELTAGMSFTFTAAGGTSPYTFTVTGNGRIDNTGKFTADDTPLPPTATVTVTDYEGDDSVSTVVTIHPSTLWMTPSGTPVTLEANTLYTFQGHGGTPPYHYTESGVGSITYDSGVYSSTTGGSTTVYVTDNASKSVNTSVYVNPPVYPLEISPTTATLETQVYLGFSASGGKSPYTFANTGVGTIISSTGLYYSQNTPGTATVTVTDNDGETATAFPITVNAPPPPLAISPSSATVVVGGSQTFTASGGTPNSSPPYYTYSLVSGVGSIGSSSGVYTSPIAGTAVVMVTDSKSRTATAPITVTNLLGITPSATSVLVDETVTLFASGGIGPYTLWEVDGGGAGGTVPGGSSGSTVVYTAPSSVGGTYTDVVRVSDSASGTATCTITVTPEDLIISPTSITLQVGNSVTFAATGGTSYTFSNTGVGSVDAGTGVYSSPVEGTAIVRVTDNYLRTQDASVTVNPPPLTLSPSSITIQAGSSITFAAEGGTPNPSPPYYTYAKVSGVGSIDASSGVYTSAVDGSATVKVTDNKSRTDTSTVTVTAPPPPPLDLSPVEVNVQTGSDQTFTAAGGTVPYAWSTTGGSVTAAGVYTAPPSVPSYPDPIAYTVRVTDAASTFRDATVLVYAPLEFTTTSATVDAGTPFDFNAAGGIPLRVFSITPDDFGSINSSSGLYTAPGTPGSVTVRVTDSQGKFAEWPFTVVDPASWEPRSRADSEKAGHHASLALDTSGNPSIAYYEEVGKDLRLARWNGTSWSREDIVEGANDDKHPSLVIDGWNQPRVAWNEEDDHSLRYALKTFFWDTDTVVSSNVGPYVSLALEGLNPRIAYYDDHDHDLRYVEKNGFSWGSPQMVDSTDDVGKFASLVVNGSGNPCVAYYDATNGNLKYAEWDGDSWDPETVDSAGDVGRYSSLKINGSGRPCIAYYDATNGDLKYAEWNGASWDTETVDDSSSDVGQYASLGFDSSGHPRIAYHDYYENIDHVPIGDLKYAGWSGSMWIIGTVDTGGTNNVGRYASLAVTSAGLMRIAYQDATVTDLYLISEQP